MEYTQECSNSNAQHAQDEPFVQMCVVPISDTKPSAIPV